MPEEMVPQVIAQLFAAYGPAALPVIGLLLIIKYLLDKDKQRETASKVELEAERQRTREERARGDRLQDELLREARGNASLAEELQKTMQSLVKGNS